MPLLQIIAVPLLEIIDVALREIINITLLVGNNLGKSKFNSPRSFIKNTNIRTKNFIINTTEIKVLNI